VNLKSTGTVEPAIRVSGLKKRFGQRCVLDRVSFEVAPGEIVAVLGPSGAGKTTLFRCLTRLIPLDEGEIVLGGHPVHTLDGRRLAQARRDIGLIFQHYNLVRRLSALDNVLAGRLGHVPTWRVLLGRFPLKERELALMALDRVGMLSHAHQRADSLSGGQQQRVAIARTLAQQSGLILADEPVASLDPESAKVVLSILRDVARERAIAVVVSLHQVEFAKRFADRVIGLSGGFVVANQPASQFAELDHGIVYSS